MTRQSWAKNLTQLRILSQCKIELYFLKIKIKSLCYSVEKIKFTVSYTCFQVKLVLWRDTSKKFYNLHILFTANFCSMHSPSLSQQVMIWISCFSSDATYRTRHDLASTLLKYLGIFIWVKQCQIKTLLPSLEHEDTVDT